MSNSTQIQSNLAAESKFSIFSILQGIFGLHDRSPTDPLMKDAARVRRMANSYLKTSPSYAADLYAAADRSETLAGR